MNTGTATSPAPLALVSGASSGIIDTRRAVDTPSARSIPASTCWRETGALSMLNSTSPFSTAAMDGAVPR